jgi:periplasmic divalent cation tolerance protein
MSEIVLVLTTVPAGFDAPALAQELVRGRLAACVSIFPAVQSIYAWKGGIEDDREQQLVIKTTGSRIEAVWATLKARHPYDVPEFMVVSVAGGNQEYLDWIERSTGGDGQ